MVKILFLCHDKNAELGKVIAPQWFFGPGSVFDTTHGVSGNVSPPDVETLILKHVSPICQAEAALEKVPPEKR